MVLIHMFHMRTLLEFMMLYEIVTYRADFIRLPILMLLNHTVGMVLVTFYLTPYWTYRKTQQLFNPVDFSMKASKNDKKAN